MLFPPFEPVADRVALRLEVGCSSYGDLAAAAAREADRLAGSHGRAACAHPAEVSLAALARLVAAARRGIPVVLLPADSPGGLAELARRRFGATLPDEDPAHPVDADAVPEKLPPGGVVLLTSGTSGEPKAVVHTWESLSAPVRVRPALEGSVWMLTYPYHLYAGLQVLLHVLLNRGTLVSLPADPGPSSVLRRMAEAGVEYVSATPSFFRRLVAFGGAVPGGLRLRQLTLGGERVGQDLLDALRSRFPDARLVHIYATSELGRCFSVDDGREGFPARWLEEPLRDGVRLRIRDGQLEVRPAFPMNRYAGDRPAPMAPDGWYRTGDLVERTDDRVLFRGRRTDLINVGGFKVNPARVEDALRTCPGVRDIRVFARSSALAGELVGAEVELAPGADEEATRAALRAAATHLAEPERPRFLRFVNEVGRTAAGKVARRQGEDG